MAAVAGRTRWPSRRRARTPGGVPLKRGPAARYPEMAMKLSLGRLPWYAQSARSSSWPGRVSARSGARYAAPAGGLAERRTARDPERGNRSRSCGGTSASGIPPPGRHRTSAARSSPGRAARRTRRGELLRRVQAMATQSNLTILGFTPRQSPRGDARRVAHRAAVRGLTTTWAPFSSGSADSRASST